MNDCRRHFLAFPKVFQQLHKSKGVVDLVRGGNKICEHENLLQVPHFGANILVTNMYQPALELLNKKNIVFVDDCQRRVALLKNVGLRFSVCNASPTENFKSDEIWSVPEYVETAVLHKVLETEKLYSNYGFSPDIIIACQTSVKLDANYKTRQEIVKMLSGKSYIVHAGVVIKAGEKVIKFTESIKVYIKEMTENAIRIYLNNELPFDKSMPYGILGITRSIVEKLEGDVFTLTGLPLFRLTKELEKLVS